MGASLLQWNGLPHPGLPLVLEGECSKTDAWWALKQIKSRNAVELALWCKVTQLKIRVGENA